MNTNLMTPLNKFFNIRGVEFQETPNLKKMYIDNLNIAWPATIEGALQSIIHSIDTMMVGSMGAAAISAVGLVGQPRMILLVLAQAICVGTTAMIARRKGANDQKSANSCLKQSMTIITVVGFLMAALGYILAYPFMNLAGANEDTLEMSVSYFRIICIGLPLNCWLLCICAAMRAIGKTRITMITNVTANLVNVLGNYCLIGGHLGFPELGIRGAAIATVAGTAVGTIIAFIFVMQKDGYLQLKIFEPVKFDKVTMKGLTNVGLSSMAETVCLRVGFLITSRLIADLGTNEFAAYQIVSQVTSLSFTLGDGIAAAGTSMVGQSLGAKRKDLAMAHAKISRKISVLASIFLMILIFLLRKLLPLLFTSDPAIIRGVELGFIVVIFGIYFQNGRVVFSGCLRGAGDAKYVALCSLLSVTIVRPLFTYLICYPLNTALPWAVLSITGPWIAFNIDCIIRDLMLTRRIKNGRWLNIVL